MTPQDGAPDIPALIARLRAALTEPGDAVQMNKQALRSLLQAIDVADDVIRGQSVREQQLRETRDALTTLSASHAEQKALADVYGDAVARWRPIVLAAEELSASHAALTQERDELRTRLFSVREAAFNAEAQVAALTAARDKDQ